ncbi:MAG TPA: GTPase, partial [Bacteroidia bacterium]|nr:GTPase [Bacteroidia bacterium]
NEERAIVSNIPGTTRDTIEEVISINGIAFRLTDTAGIRHAADIIEREGVERTMQKIKQAAIVLYLFDADTMSAADVLADMKKLGNVDSIEVIPIANKIDLTDSINKFKNIPNLLYISARSGQGIEELKNHLYNAALQGATMQESVVLTNSRHYEALQLTLQNLANAKKGIENKLSGELVASDIRSALAHLGEITGEVTTDDLLGNIFSRFCIGK